MAKTKNSQNSQHPQVLEVEVQRQIGRGADVVRGQFMDIAHHIRQNVHPRLTFTLHTQNETEVLYSLTQSVCGCRLVDEYRSSLTPAGTVLGEVLSGSNAGMKTEIFFEPLSATVTHTRVRLTTPLQGWVRWLAPVYAWAVRRSLAHALEQDGHDLEAGHYPS
ncbi:MAG: hypothetical protein ACH34Y_02320 [Brachymonas sp.]|jgi:hypothetical protein